MVNYSEEEVDRLSVVNNTDEKKTGLFAQLKLPLIIVAIVILTGVGGGWWFLIRPGATEETVENKGVDTLATTGMSETEHDPPPFGEIFTIKDLVVNPAGGRRIFMVSLSLEYFNSKDLAEMQRREPILRDNLITFFSSQPPDYLSNIKYRQALRSRVKKIMDYQLGEGVVSRVIFQKWIFQ